MKLINKILILFILLFRFSTVTLFAQGVIQWQRTYGGSSGEACTSIQQTSDGGFILGGFSNSNISGDKNENNTDPSGTTYDYWIVKTNPLGNIQWQNTIGGTDQDPLRCLDQTTDGGYIFGGESSSDISGDKTENNWDTTRLTRDLWIVKTDTSGNIQWENTIGTIGVDELYEIHQTLDGGYIIVGSTWSNNTGDKSEVNIGYYDCWIIKTDWLGNIQWQNAIGGTDGELNTAIQQTSDGGYIVGASSKSNISGDKTDSSFADSYDYWIVKINSTGNIQWQNTIGGNEFEGLSSLLQTSDGGYIIGGSSRSNISGDKMENNFDTTGVTYDYWIIKIDSIGNIIWQNTIGGDGNELLSSILQTTDGGYIVGGVSTSNMSVDKTENNIDTTLATYDYWIVKLDSLGNIQWDNTIGGNDEDYLTSIIQTSEGGYLISGNSSSNISGDKTINNLGPTDFWIVKLYPDVTTGVSESVFQSPKLSIYPNPATNELAVTGYRIGANEITELLVYDVLGKEIFSTRLSSNSYLLNTAHYPSGMYLLKAGNSFTKFVKQ